MNMAANKFCLDCGVALVVVRNGHGRKRCNLCATEKVRASNRESARRWTSNNNKKANENWRAWRKRNPEQTRQIQKAWREKNRETVNEYSSRARKRSPEARRALQAARRAREKMAIPSWADMAAIKRFYLDCPDGHHVDHIVPLSSPVVCGLHVIENLQYLVASENCKKRNHFDL